MNKAQDPFIAKNQYSVVWKTSALQSFSGKEEERQKVPITITKSNKTKDLE